MSNFMASQDAKISKFEADFKRYQSEMTNKMDALLKAFNDQMTGALLILEVLAHVLIYDALLDKYIVSLELSENGSLFIQSVVPEKMKDPRLFILPCRLGDFKPFDTLADLGSCVNLIPLSLFKKLKIGLLKETEDVLGLADETKSYPVGIVNNVEVHVGKLRLFKDFHVVDMEREPNCLLLVGRGFLATANSMIDCKKAKITVGEGLTRSIFGVRELDFGARPPYYAKNDFWDNNLPREWEIAIDAEVNPFKDILVFRKMLKDSLRKMVEFLGTIPINLKGNMWESEDVIDDKMDWNKPPKEGDGAWHIRIELINPGGEKLDRAFQSIQTTRK
ncbi:MAK10-like protein [Tanacetum coccineum]